jgi:hypothetical protein
MSTWESENLRRFLLIPGGVMVILFILESLALLKVLDYSRIIRSGPHDQFADTNRGDPELLHIHPPHSSFRGISRGGNIAANFRIPASDIGFYQWDVRYDRNGFRNDLDLNSAEVVVIGDSFVESITTPTSQLMTTVLAHFQGNVVANLGQYGYGPLEELAVLRRYGLPLRPRSAVWMFFEGNDLKDVIHYRNVTTAPPKPPPNLWSAFWDRSLTRSVMAEVYTQFRRALRPSGTKRCGIIQTPEGGRLTQYFLYSSPPLTKDDLSALEQTTVTLAAAHDLCAAQGVRLVFVLVPTKFRVFHDLCQFPPESECRNWTLNDLPERLESAMRSISPDIGYLDLTPSLVDAAKRGLLPYYIDDDHWSPEGHRIAGEAINAYLRVASAPAAGRQIRPKPVSARRW